jgi:hypothetical protein
MSETERWYWVPLIVDNSVPQLEPNADGFLPMRFNAAPLIRPAGDGEDALCVFTTEGRAIGYGRAAVEDPIAPAAPGTVFPLDSREDFEQFTSGYPAAYVGLDPEYGEEGESVPLEEFLDNLD